MYNDQIFKGTVKGEGTPTPNYHGERGYLQPALYLLIMHCNNPLVYIVLVLMQ